MTERELGTSGHALWGEMVAIYELDPGDESILLEACRTADELDRLNGDIVRAKVMVKGSTGQPRANPLLEEARRHRKTLAELMKQLDRPANSKAMSEFGRAAAHKRWGRQSRPTLVRDARGGA